VDWSQLAQNRDPWQAFVSKTKLQMEFLDQLSDSERNLLYRVSYEC
jgi:hypothetical protein